MPGDRRTDRLLRRLLVGASALALLPAPAAADQRLRLELSGFYRFFGVVGRQDDGPGRPGAGFRDYGVARGSEVFFSGDVTLPNGVAVGVEVQLEGETDPDQIDESYVFFEGVFGRLELGSKDPAPDSLLFGPPIPIPGHGVNSPQHFHAIAGSNAVSFSLTFVNLTFDSDKITYFTPRIGGFAFGASYTPDDTEELGAGFRPDTTPGQFSEAVEAGANWVGSWGEVDLGAHLGYARAEREVGGPGLGDRRQWGAGGQLGWRRLVLGASFRHDDLGVSGADRIDWNLGAAYRFGRWTLAGAFAHAEADLAPGGGRDELDHLEIGLTYVLGPGVVLAGGVQRVVFDGAGGRPGASNEALIALFGTELTF